jgi:hypothetical protein
MDIETMTLLKGSLPKRVIALVLEWAFEHRDELRANWGRAEKHQELENIKPLE